MPLDALGCTRATMFRSMCLILSQVWHFDLLTSIRDWTRLLQLLFSNEEFPVSIYDHFVLIMSLPFVHTARRSYRLEAGKL